MSKFDGTTWTSYTTANGLANNWVYAVAIDAANNKWFGTQNGISKFDGVNWTTYTTEDGLPKKEILAIAIDQHDNKWFATLGGGVVLLAANGVAIEETKTPMYQILTNDTGIEIAGLQGGEMITLYDLNGKELCCKIAEGNSSSIHYTKLQKVVVKIDQQAFVVSF